MIVIGQTGSGKSELANKLLALTDESDVSFVVTGRSGRKALGCVYLSAPIDWRDSSIKYLHVVDTPGLFEEGVSSDEKYWRDLTHAFDISKERKVHAFLLLLKANDPSTGEKVLRVFLVSIDFCSCNIIEHKITNLRKSL